MEAILKQSFEYITCRADGIRNQAADMKNNRLLERKDRSIVTEDVIEQQSRWYKLDNAAKIYPAILNPKDSCVYRVAVNLMQEVDPSVLQQAVTDCRRRFPSLYVKLKRGIFWNYYEHNEKTPVVRPESPIINQHICPYINNGYLFSLFYYKKRISLEVFHGLCDGYSALEFLKALVFRYFVLLGYPNNSEDAVMTVDQQPRSLEFEDSFLKHYKPVKAKLAEFPPAYRIQGTRFECGIGVINGRMPMQQLLALAKKSGASITQYLTALLTYCIWQTGDMAQSEGNAINICIPVNMRKNYNSQTLRNFTLYFYVSTDCTARDKSFEEILEHVKTTFKEELNMDKLQQRLNANVAIEKNIALRISPLFLKNLAIKIACVILGDKLNTCALSNVGQIVLPSWMKEVVKSFDCNTGVGNVATHSVAMNTYNDLTTISFTRSVVETDIERLFFSFMSERGVEIEIQSNQWETVV